MPPAEDIQRQMLGAWRMMTGRRDGMRLLDLSVDGFWNSFFAIVVAAPVLSAGKVAGHRRPAGDQHRRCDDDGEERVPEAVDRQVEQPHAVAVPGHHPPGTEHLPLDVFGGRHRQENQSRRKRS